MKSKFISALTLTVLLGGSLSAWADTTVNGPTLIMLALTKTAFPTPGALIGINLPNTQQTGCYLNIMILDNVTDQYQKELYATLLTAKVNNLLIQSISFSSTCQITGISI